MKKDIKITMKIFKEKILKVGLSNSTREKYLKLDVKRLRIIVFT